MTVLRILFKKLGGHYNCHVFTAKAAGQAFAKNGDLVFDEREWPDIRRAMRNPEFIAAPGDEELTPQSAQVDEWGIVELFGHVRLAGRVSEIERFGGKMLRLDIPKPDGGWAATQFVGHAALYRVTPTTEDIARASAAHLQPEPMQRWELEPPIPPPSPDMPTGYGGMIAGREPPEPRDYDTDDQLIEPPPPIEPLPGTPADTDGEIPF